MKIRKAVIPAAGLGTRFLPATKAQPKEMLPIVDKPAIQYIVEEAVAAGIEDIVIVTGRGKRAIEDHFDKSYELEENLKKKGKLASLLEVEAISNLANIHYIRQKEPNGLGDAIYTARRFIGNEPFAVLLGDDIIDSEKPALKQLIDVYNRYSTSVVGVQEVPEQDVSKFGIVAVKQHLFDDQEELFYISSLVEKPVLEEAPSSLAIMGRYILKPEIFDVLEHIPPGSGGEIQLTDAINRLNDHQAVIAYPFKGQRYDIGDKIGFLKATIDFALQREELRDELLEYIRVTGTTRNYSKIVE